MRRGAPIFLISLVVLLLIPFSAQGIDYRTSLPFDKKSKPNSTMVGPMVYYLLERGADLPVSVMFSHEPAKSEIRFFEDRGVLFMRRNGAPIHIGSIYVANITDLDALGILAHSEIVKQINAVSQPLLLISMLVASIAVISAVLILKRRH